MGLLLVLIGLSACSGDSKTADIERIAFGSCLRQDLPQPIWEGVNRCDPDLWIWLGDNIYGDTGDFDALSGKYDLVKAQAGYAALRQKAQIMGTWDDHDFGKNNGGKEFEGKVAAQRALLDFLDEPADSPRRKQEGVYWTQRYGSGERTVRVILLDVRYHRDEPGMPDGDVLGRVQWDWLKRVLEQKDAQVTLIASGIQVLPEDHRYEKWAQFPEARERLFSLIAETGGKGVVFLSGDRHISEFSQHRPTGSAYPLHEFTSSSLTHAWKQFPGEPNRHRVGEVYSENNFGLLEIDWDQSLMTASIRNEAGDSVQSLEIPF